MRAARKDDYWPVAEQAIHEALDSATNGHLPWIWWQGQASQFGVSPNTLYTRAIKKGIYTPPAERNREHRTRQSTRPYHSLASSKVVSLDETATENPSPVSLDKSKPLDKDRLLDASAAPPSSGPAAGVGRDALRQAEGLHALAQRVQALEAQLAEVTFDRDHLRLRCDHLADVLRRTADLLEEQGQAIRRSL